MKFGQEIRDLVDGGIVKNFMSYPDIFLRKLLSGLISNLNSPLHTPAESI